MSVALRVVVPGEARHWFIHSGGKFGSAKFEEPSYEVRVEVR